MSGLNSFKLENCTPVRVFFLDNSSKVVLVDESTKAVDIVFNLLEKYDILDSSEIKDYFALYVSLDGVTVGHALKADMMMAPLLQTWEEGSSTKLVFMQRLFTSSSTGIHDKAYVAAQLRKPLDLLSHETFVDMAEDVDSNLIHLRYIQSVYSVITGMIYTTEKEAIDLAAIHFLVKFCHCDQSSWSQMQAGVSEFIPVRLAKKQLPGYWEQVIVDTAKDLRLSHNTFDVNRLERLYLNRILCLDESFGSSFFRAKMGSHRVVVRVHCGGLDVLERQERQPLHVGRMENMKRWGFSSENIFFLEIDCGESNISSVELETPDAQCLANLLTDYALLAVRDKERSNSSFGGNRSRGNSTVDNPSGQHGNSSSVATVMGNLKIDNDRTSFTPAAGLDRLMSSVKQPPPPPSRVPPQSVAQIPLPPTTQRVPRDSARGSGVLGGVLGDVPSAPRGTQQHARAPSVEAGRNMGFDRQSEEERQAAAIRIQACYRGSVARVFISDLIEEMFQNGELVVGEEESAYS
jgi:hypothetical protein